MRYLPVVIAALCGLAAALAAVALAVQLGVLGPRAATGLLGDLVGLPAGLAGYYAARLGLERVGPPR